MNVTTILAAAVVLVAVDLLAWWVFLGRRRRTTWGTVAAGTPAGGAPPLRSAPRTLAGGRVISCRSVPSAAAERGSALVDLRLEVGGRTGVVVRTTWDVELHALAHLQQDAVVPVEVWDRPTVVVQPAVPWARAWPPPAA
jgi:hypothetical protein